MRWLSAVYSAVYAWPFPGPQSWLSKNISTSLSILTFFFVFSGFFTCAIFSSIPRKSTHQHVWIIWTKPLQVLEPFYLQGFDRGWLCVCAFRLAAWGNYMEPLSCRKNKQSFLARQCAADNTCSPSAALSLSELVFQDEPNGPELFWYWCSPENSESQCCISCISWIVCNMHAIFLRYVASRCSHCFQDLSSNCLSVWPSDSYIWKVNASFECQHLGSSRWSHLNSVWRKRLLHRAPTNVFIVNPTKHSASLGKPTNRLLLQLCSSLYALHMPRWYLCYIITLNNIFNHIEYWVWTSDTFYYHSTIFIEVLWRHWFPRSSPASLTAGSVLLAAVAAQVAGSAQLDLVVQLRDLQCAAASTKSLQHVWHVRKRWLRTKDCTFGLLHVVIYIYIYIQYIYIYIM